MKAFASFIRLRLFVLYLIGLWLALVVLAGNNPASLLQKDRVAGMPFGFFRAPGGGVYVQDFSYNLMFFRAIRDGVVAHPYRFADQEELVHRVAPGVSLGMSHAYSPVAYVLALPLLPLPGAPAYFLYSALGAVGLLLLYRLELLPRAIAPLQLYALALCAISVSLLLTMELGQSALPTTVLLGIFWAALRSDRRTPQVDLALAVLFWATCLKPSVAIIPLALLLGAQRRRALLIGFLLLGGTWLAVAAHYGGWWTGLGDYAHLLDHYDNADFPPFLRRDYTPGHDAEIHAQFLFDRLATATATLVLLALTWTRRLSLSGLLQGMIGVFLLFAPYLLPSEDLVLALLVAESRFFADLIPWRMAAKLLLLGGIMDLRSGLLVPWDVHLPCKWLLFAWILAEAVIQTRRLKPGISGGSFVAIPSPS